MALAMRPVAWWGPPAGLTCRTAGAGTPLAMRVVMQLSASRVSPYTTTPCSCVASSSVSSFRMSWYVYTGTWERQGRRRIHTGRRWIHAGR
eukprot:1180486-Prorocentrum_minimum.AAC.3